MGSDKLTRVYMHCSRILCFSTKSLPPTCWFFFFFNEPAPPEIYPLPLPDPLPIFRGDLVDAARRRATAGEDDAALSDVGAKLGGSLFERLLHGAHDTLQRLLQRLEDLVAVECEIGRAHV